MLFRSDVGPDSTVVGIPGRVIHQSGVRIDPLAHSALPDAEARVIRNLMERIDSLEGELARTMGNLRDLRSSQAQERDGRGRILGVAQSLRDREILEYLGDGSGEAALPAGDNGAAAPPAGPRDLGDWWGDGGGI